jgi:hypothetical protein
MGLKEDLKKTVDNVKDAFNEAGHKVNAENEQAKRDLAGDALTPAETVKSVANQAKEESLAGMDRAKQAIRNNS